MNYLNLETNDMRSPEFVMASARERGAWVSMMLHAVATENGGVMTGAGLWTERHWLQICGLTFEDLSCDRNGNPEGNTSLWYWISNDLYLWGFPHDKLAQVNAGREGGKKGGRPRKAENPPQNPSVNPPSKPAKPSPEPTAKPERKGMEGKENGKEEKEKESKAPDKPGRARDECFEALVEIQGLNLAELTKPMRGQINLALKSIRDVMPEVTAEEIHSRAKAYRAEWPSVHLTANALAKHWAGFGKKKEGGPPADGEAESPALPLLLLPDWPWRAVAKFILEWIAVPDSDEAWHTLDLPVQKSVFKAWKGLGEAAQQKLREATL
jgi:hypothetical protein